MAVGSPVTPDVALTTLQLQAPLSVRCSRLPPQGASQKGGSLEFGGQRCCPATVHSFAEAWFWFALWVQSSAETCLMLILRHVP